MERDGQITCTSSNPQFYCQAQGLNVNGVASWSIEQQPSNASGSRP